MKKYIISVLIITSLLLSSCSIDWDDEKSKEIIILNDKINTLNDKINTLQFNLSKNELEQKRLTDKQNFDNNLRCQDRGDKLSKEFNNVVSGYFKEDENTCYVIYLENKIREESRMDEFGRI